jgi:DNA-binding transcriptional MerR regulator
MKSDFIQTAFSIKDLENLSGVKAHTIRIWEKRYNLLNPSRSETNIRNYDSKSLQKLLNIKLLLENGFKISKIALLNEHDLINETQKIVVKELPESMSYNSLKFSMLNFDAFLFETTYQKLTAQYDFKTIFLEIFLPFLDEIGLLWQTYTITPAHEHFISNLIKQKVLLNIENQKFSYYKAERTFVLFLPLNEIHELGLLFIHYELLSKGLQSIYLGASVPIGNLTELMKVFPHIEYISYFTVKPEKEEVQTYLEEIYKEVLTKRDENLHILGRNTAEIKDKILPNNVKNYANLEAFITEI